MLLCGGGLYCCCIYLSNRNQSFPKKECFFSMSTEQSRTELLMEHYIRRKQIMERRSIEDAERVKARSIQDEERAKARKIEDQILARCEEEEEEEERNRTHNHTKNGR